MGCNDQRLLQELIQINSNLTSIQALFSVRRKILNFSDGVKYLGVSESYLYKLTSANKIPFYRPTGKLIFFKKEELDAWLLQNRQATTGEIQQSANNFSLKGS